MKVSELQNRDIRSLTNEQIEAIVYSGIEPEPDEPCDYGIVLGTKPLLLHSRAHKAADLYNRGLVKKIIVSGGKRWYTGKGFSKECTILRREIMKCGVPKKDIILEKKARTTKENILCSLVCMLQDDDTTVQHTVVLITSPGHLKRSLYLAHHLLPVGMKLYGAWAEGTNDAPGKWMHDERIRPRILREIAYYRDCICGGWMDDIEVDMLP